MVQPGIERMSAKPDNQPAGPARRWLPSVSWPLVASVIVVAVAIGVGIAQQSHGSGQRQDTGSNFSRVEEFAVPPKAIPATPPPAVKEPADRHGKYVAVAEEPEKTLVLGVGRTSLLRLKEPAARIMVSDQRILAYEALGRVPREISLWGRAPGATTLTLWFGDLDDVNKQTVLSYLVQVVQDPGQVRPAPASGVVQAGYQPPAGYQQQAVYQQPVGGPDLYGDQPPIEVSLPAMSGRRVDAPVPGQPRPMMPGEALPLTRPGQYEQGQGQTFVQSRGMEQVPPAGQPRPTPPAETGPMPRRLDTLPGARSGAGAPPVPTSEIRQRYNQLVERTIDAEVPLELIVGRPRVMQFRELPFRFQVGDDTILSYVILGRTPREISLLGQKVGTTVFNIWFGDPDDPTKQTILSYLVNVIPDPGIKSRLEAVYKALEDEINRAFPDAYVQLFLVGDKLVVCGQVKDAIDHTTIMQVVRANAPAAGRGQAASNPAANIPLTLSGAGVGPDGQPLVGLERYILEGETNVIDLLRIPGEQQVMLKVTVAEVSRSAARSLGVNFSIRNNAGVTVFAQNTGNLLTSASAAVGSTTNVANLPIFLDNGKISLAVQALRNVNLARSLAETTVVALNGHVGRLLSGGEFPVPVLTGTALATATGVNFVPFGVQVNFTPYVTDKDRIRLTLDASVSVRDVATGTNFASQGGSSTFVPGLNTRNIATTVEMREGQTLAIGGLLQTNLGGDTTRVPLLGDIPFGGQFFRNDHTSASESELILLVTPELVHPMEPKEIPPLPGSDYFEPGDCAFFLHGRLESDRSYDYRSPVMHDIRRMKAYHNCEIRYMLGPVGYSDEHDQQQQLQPPQLQP